jgi:hypothetical protein
MNGLRTTITTLAIGATALALVGVAAASPPLHGTTTITVTSDVVVSAREADGNTIVTEEQLTGSLTGALTGTSSLTTQGVIHADGSGEFHGTGTFTGTVAGCGSTPVSLRFVIEFQVSPTGEISGRTANIAGTQIKLVSTLQGSVFSPVFAETDTYHC